MQTFEFKCKPTTRFTPEQKDQRRNVLASRLGLKETVADAEITHLGYFDYLARAWSAHYSVVIRPDDFWYVILCELAETIKSSPAYYASLFTTTPDKKQWILVPTDDVRTIDPALVIDHLKCCIPTDSNIWLPEFSTTTENSRLAHYVAFCDMVSPYYNYGTYLCGFPAIRIEGTLDDWKRMRDCLMCLSELFSGKLSDYAARVMELISNCVKSLTDGDCTFWSKIVKLEECGSGHQFEMSGWILGLLKEQKTQIPLEGLPTHISFMNYKNLDTQRQFRMYCGSTTSHFTDGFLVPSYTSHVKEITEKSESEKAMGGLGSSDDLPSLKKATLLNVRSDRVAPKLNLQTSKITPKTRKLRAIWTVEFPKN